MLEERWFSRHLDSILIDHCANRIGVARPPQGVDNLKQATESVWRESSLVYVTQRSPRHIEVRRWPWRQKQPQWINRPRSVADDFTSALELLD
jgi:hypothetical protein